MYLSRSLNFKPIDWNHLKVFIMAGNFRHMINYRIIKQNSVTNNLNKTTLWKCPYTFNFCTDLQVFSEWVSKHKKKDEHNGWKIHSIKWMPKNKLLNKIYQVNKLMINDNKYTWFCFFTNTHIWKVTPFCRLLSARFLQFGAAQLLTILKLLFNHSHNSKRKYRRCLLNIVCYENIFRVLHCFHLLIFVKFGDV